MLTLPQTLHAQVQMDITKGENKWGYTAAVGGIVQKWDGSDVTINTTLNLKDADAKKGNLPRECFVGILIQDTRQATRYVAGLLNRGYTKHHKQLPIGIVRHENKGNWKPLSVKGMTLPADQSLELQLQFKGSKLILSGCEAGGKLQELMNWDAPEGFKPNLIGLAADGFKNGFGPVTFEQFNVVGKGPAVSDPFDGSVDTGKWVQVDDKRLTIEMPGKMQVGLQLDENDFIYDRGKDIHLKLNVQGTRHASLPLYIQVENDLGVIVHQNTSDVSLAKSRVIDFQLPAKAVSRNGVYQLSLRLGLDEDPLYASTSQFAVIEPRKVSPQPDPKSPYIYCWGREHVPTLARMGMRWQRNSWFMRHLKPNAQGQYNFDRSVAGWAQMGKDYGMPPIGPICDVRIDDHTAASIEKYVDTHVQIIKQARERFGQQVQVIEIGNEPENWPRAPIANEWLTMAKAQAMITERVHKEVPGVRVMSTGTTHVNFGFLSQLAAIGGPDAADIIGVHGYRTPSPPEFGHDQEVAAIESLFPGKDIWVNEQAYFSLAAGAKFDYDTPVFYPTRMPELQQAIYVARLFLCQFAAGFDGVAYYAWHSDHGITDSPTHVRPVAPALAAFTWLLPHPEFKRRLTPANTELWALQFESDGQTITGVWSLNHDYDVSFNAAEIENAYDIYGNVIQLKPINGVVTMRVGQAPIYLRGKVSNVLSFKDAKDSDQSAYPSLAKALQSGGPVSITFEPDVRSMNDSRLAVRLTNHSNDEITGKLQVKFNDRVLKDAPSSFLREPIPSAWHIEPENGGAFTIDAHSSITVSCRVVSDDASLPFDPYASREAFAGCWWLTGYLFAVRVTLDDQSKVDAFTNQGLSLRGVPYQPEIKIDGSLNDWQDVPLFPQAGLRARNTGHNRFWHGAADYEPTFKIAFNDQGLLFAAIVTDDIQYQPYTGMDMWRCDSVELAIDADVEDDSAVNYHVFLMGQPNKGKAEVVRRRSTSDRPAGVISDATIQVSRIKPSYGQLGQTVYEVLIPWQQITPYQANQSRLNFAVQFNEADGWERTGWEGWFIPMGGQLIDSQKMGDLTLIRK
ncbi:MAG: sugar-binding protein [Phycisphaeraceae bacterium JB051]